MALKGLDIFKLTPKTNCKDCGNPTCMAFAMKVAQGGVSLDKCPHLSAEALATLGEATAPPMKTINLGSGAAKYTLGGETVLYRHDKTFVNKMLYAVTVCEHCFDEKWEQLRQIDYERIGERMYVELLTVKYTGSRDGFLNTVKKASATSRTLVLECDDLAIASDALALCSTEKPLLMGATAANYAEMNELAQKYGVVLGVHGANLDELYDTVAALEAVGNKNLIINVTASSIKETFANAVQLRRAALKDKDRTCGYPSYVDLTSLTGDNADMQAALAALFTMKYGSIVVLKSMTYADALPLFGLRQNIFTDPQKPMKVAPGIYPLNGADENAVCCTTVDFALTYFVVSGEMERSGVPVNLLVSDAGGYSVLTSWAAGKFSANTIAKFIRENEIESKIKNRTLIIPGKVAVLKGELEDALPGWTIVVGPNEAVEIVRFMKNYGK